MKVYEAVAETLSRLGVDTTFGLVGSGNFGLIDHMTRYCIIAYYASRHEASAVAMADGYARVSGRQGLSTDLALLVGLDFAAIAGAMGARGLEVRGTGDLERLEEWIEDPDGVMVVDCKVNPRV